MNIAPVPLIEVHEDADDLATSVAGAFIRLLIVRQAAGEIPQVCLTGGTIAERIHEEIARHAPDSGVDWSRVDFFWGDERFEPAGSDERNATHARAAFLDVVGADPARVHEVPTRDDVGSVAEAADSYAQVVRSAGSGRFHLLMLGVGPDGHVASLFPGHPQLDAREAVVVPVTDSPKPPPERVTLTFEALNRSDEVWFVVSGTDKAEAVGRALARRAPDVHEIPAVGVRGALQTIWFLDRESASRVP